MLVYYRKIDGVIVYMGATGLPKHSLRAIEMDDWRFNLGPMGLNANDIETLEVDEQTEAATVDRLLTGQMAKVEPAPAPVQAQAREWVAAVAAERGEDPPSDIPPVVGVVFSEEQPRTAPPPLPDAVRRQREASERLRQIRTKGVKNLTPAEKDEVLELMLLERTPPHELLEG